MGHEVIPIRGLWRLFSSDKDDANTIPDWMENDMTQRRAVLQALGLASLAATSGIGLAACSNDPAPPQEDGSGPVELRVAIFSSNEGHLEVLNSIGVAYVAAHSDRVNKVVFDTLPADAYITALQTQIAGGQSPDLAWVFEANARQFVDGGAFVDVTDTLKQAEGYAFDDVVAEALRVWQQDDKVFAYPFSNSPFGIYANLDLIKAAGGPAPRELLDNGEWTWGRLAESAAQVAASDSGLTGFQAGVDPFDGWLDGLGTMWPQWGARPWTEDGTDCQLTSQPMLDFFGWFHEQIHQTGAHAKPGEVFDMNSGQTGFKIGLLSGSRLISEAGFDWDFLPLPEGPAGAHPIVGQSGIGVLSQSSKIEAAKHFLAWFTNPESGAKLSQFFPQPRTSLLTVENLKQVSPLLTDEMISGTIIDQASRGTTKQGHKNLSRITDKVKVHLDAYWPSPNADLAALMEKACADIEADLE